MDPDPLRLLETAPPLRSSTLSANPANSRFSVREDRRLASSEAVNKIPQKTLTDQLRSLVLVLERLLPLMWSRKRGPVYGLLSRRDYVNVARQFIAWNSCENENRPVGTV